MTDMKIVTEKNINGEDQLVIITTPAFGNQGHFAGILVDAGKPYWAWPSIPLGSLAGCNFAGAPIIQKTNIGTPAERAAAAQANLDAIAAITVTPLEVLTYVE